MNAPMPPEEAKLPWVPLSRRPERIGVFQVRNTAHMHDELSWFSFWDGMRWHGAWRSPDEAFERKQFPVAGSVLSGWEWRGLASNPLAGSTGACVSMTAAHLTPNTDALADSFDDQTAPSIQTGDSHG